MTLHPQNPQEVQDMVTSHKALQPYAGRSKPALSAPVQGAIPIDMRQLCGLIEYEPNEYTFTAYAGTPVSEVAEELAKHGQYLPFDPLFAAAGATLGGTVAANSSGSGRYRYGGVRDFIIGIRFVDGFGRLVNSGGKVVKNAAGFDLPKFMTGALGRYGILTEVTFKIFPKPRAYLTLQVTYDSLETALQATFTLANQPYDMDALDLQPSGATKFNLLLRLGGIPNALSQRATRLQQFLTTQTAASEPLIRQAAADALLWADINTMHWADPKYHLVKIPIAPKQLPKLHLIEPISQAHYSAAGNVAWVAVKNLDDLDKHLKAMNLAGLVLRGPAGQPYIGHRQGISLAQRVKQALDPHGKFLEAL